MGAQQTREAEHANLAGIYGFLEIDPLTIQEEQFVLLLFRGMTVPAASRGAGMTPPTGHKILERESVQQLLAYMREQIFTDTRISLETLNSMAFEAHRKSVSSTEELNAVQVLGKLNMLGGFAPNAVVAKRLELERGNSEGEDITPKSTKALERMAGDKLLELANFDGLDSIDPIPVKKREPVVEVEGECEAVDE